MNDTGRTLNRGDRVRSLQWENTYGTVTRDAAGSTVYVRWDGTSFEDERDLVAVELVTEHRS